MDGELVVRWYDQNCKFLGEKMARDNATLTSAAFDGQRFYVAFMDNSQRVTPEQAAFNMRLAAFDRDWNLVEEIPVTSYSPADGIQVDSAGLLLHDNRLYVTYTESEVNPETFSVCPGEAPCEGMSQAYVSVYELV